MRTLAVLVIVAAPLAASASATVIPYPTICATPPCDPSVVSFMAQRYPKQGVRCTSIGHLGDGCALMMTAKAE